MDKLGRNFNFWYVLIALLGVLLLRDVWVASSQVQPIPYSEFQTRLREGQIREIAISNNVIQGRYKGPQADLRTLLRDG